MIGGLGVPELLVILVIVLVVFGAGKLPQVGANLGKAIKNFKKGVAEDKIEDQTEITSQDKIEGNSSQKKADL